MGGGRESGEKPPEMVLASCSPRRRAIFQALGLRFVAVSPEIEESPWAGEDPEQFVRLLAAAKARAVVAKLGLAAAPPWVVGADTVVVVGDRVFGQPRDAAAARAMIEALSGRSHRVLTGVSIWSGPAQLVSFVETTAVRFRSVAPAELEQYLREGDWAGKAGGYAIQGAAGVFVEAVEGDAWNVVGFPVRGFLDRARAAGIPMPEERKVRPTLARLWPIVEDEDLAERRWGPRWV